MKAGAIVGGASKEDAERLYEIGRLIGIAFQLQDDVLDTYGDEKTFGKKIGGDIRVNKKTYLLIKALESLQGKDRDDLVTLMTEPCFDEKEKFSRVVALYNKANVKGQTIEKISTYFAKAVQLLDQVQIDDLHKQELRLFMNELLLFIRSGHKVKE